MSRKLAFSLILITVMVLVATTSFAGGLAEQTTSTEAPFPNRPIDIIVGDPPGGATDVAARAFAATASPFLNGVSINVVNMPGAGQMVAFEYTTSQAKPDGYTLIVGYGEHYSKTLMGVDLPVNVNPDPAIGVLRPVIGSLAFSSAIVVPYNSPFQTLNDLVAFGKANPGTLNWGHTAAHGLHHMMGDSFLAAAGIEAVGVSLAGGANTRQGVAGGHVDYGVLATFLVPDYIRDNLVRALAIFAPERDPLTPDVPTLRELGFEVLDGFSHKSIGAPSATPTDRVQRLYEGLKQATETPEFRRMIEGQGLIVTGWAPQELQRRSQENDARIVRLIDAGIIQKVE